MSPADRAEWEARRIGERQRVQPLLPGVRWPGFPPRSLEVLYGIALDACEYWQGACMADDLFERPRAERTAWGHLHRWERVLKDLHRVLAARVPHQPVWMGVDVAAGPDRVVTA